MLDAVGSRGPPNPRSTRATTAPRLPLALGLRARDLGTCGTILARARRGWGWGDEGIPPWGDEGIARSKRSKRFDSRSFLRPRFSQSLYVILLEEDSVWLRALQQLDTYSVSILAGGLQRCNALRIRHVSGPGFQKQLDVLATSCAAQGRVRATKPHVVLKCSPGNNACTASKKSGMYPQPQPTTEHLPQSCPGGQCPRRSKPPQPEALL